MTDKPFREELTDQRVRAGLSRAEAATKLGVPADTYYRWEIGARTPNSYAARAVLAAAKGWPAKAPETVTAAAAALDEAIL